MLALGFDQTLLATFNGLVRDVISAVADTHIWTRDEDESAAALYRAAEDTTAALTASAASVTFQPDDEPAALDPLLAQMETCQKTIYSIEEHERERQAAWRNLPADHPDKANKPPESMGSYGFRGSDCRYERVDLMAGLVGRPFVPAPDLLPDRSAGSGKTHLLLDATGRALEADRPAVFLAGAQFGQGNLWASITDQLGLEAVGKDVLLQAMDAAGRSRRSLRQPVRDLHRCAQRDHAGRLLANPPTSAESRGYAVSARGARGVLPGHLPGARPGGRGRLALRHAARIPASPTARSKPRRSTSRITSSPRPRSPC